MNTEIWPADGTSWLNNHLDSRLTAEIHESMSRAALIRAGGMAAIGGGLLRTAASLAPGVGSDVERQLLYLVVDMFLLLGLLGFYELRHQDIGWHSLHP